MAHKEDNAITPEIVSTDVFRQLAGGVHRTTLYRNPAYKSCRVDGMGWDAQRLRVLKALNLPPMPSAGFVQRGRR